MPARRSTCAATPGVLLLVPVAAAWAAGGDVDVTLPSSTVTVDASARFTLPVGCDDAGPSCAGDLRLYPNSQEPGTVVPFEGAGAAASSSFGVAPFTVQPGRRVRVPIRLNAAGRGALSRRHGRPYLVRLNIRERDAAGHARTIISGRITLRAAGSGR